MYTTIPQEGVKTICEVFEPFYMGEIQIPTTCSEKFLDRYRMKENSFEISGSNCLQPYGTAMSSKMAVASADMFIFKQ